MASRAARAKPSRELAGIKRQLQELTDGVLSGEVERGVAAVCAQLLNVKLRAVEVERRVKEQEEVIERIEALEQAQQRGGSRWGA
jgi:proteasome assembly chaperone (PAC2) family protein